MTQQRGTYGAAYLRAKIGKHACDCLLDTGSEVTLIPASIVKGEDIRDTTQTVSAANILFLRVVKPRQLSEKLISQLLLSLIRV